MIDGNNLSPAQHAALKGQNLLNAMPDADAPNMGDPDFVEAQVRDMLAKVVEVRTKYLAEPDGDKAAADAQAAVQGVLTIWGQTLAADNGAIVQTMSLASQAAWLRQHGFGANDEDDHDPVRALLANTVRQVIEAGAAHENGLSEEDAQFRVDAAVEDCVSMLLGMENSGD